MDQPRRNPCCRIRISLGRRWLAESLFIASGLVMMAACAKPMPTSSPILMVRPALTHRQCLYRVEGRWLNDGELLATARKGGGQITIDADVKMPGPCFVAAMRILEMAGAKRIGFISEPPPPR